MKFPQILKTIKGNFFVVDKLLFGLWGTVKVVSDIVPPKGQIMFESKAQNYV